MNGQDRRTFGKVTGTGARAAPTPDASSSRPAHPTRREDATITPYTLHARGSVIESTGGFAVDFWNEGTTTAVFQARSGRPQDAPRCYTVEPGGARSGTWDVASVGATDYAVDVHGPNGFFRRFRGGVASSRARLTVAAVYEPEPCALRLAVGHRGRTAATITVFDGGTGGTTDVRLMPGEATTLRFELARFRGGYDVSIGVAEDPGFLRQLAGHVEDGCETGSDPAEDGRK